MTDERLFPELRFDNANNTARSLHVLGDFARTGRVRVLSMAVDPTGKIILRIDTGGPSRRRAPESPRSSR